VPWLQCKTVLWPADMTDQTCDSAILFEHKCRRGLTTQFEHYFTVALTHTGEDEP